jgi:hypothetical protein
MRLSVNQDDRGYGPEAFYAKVFLDGIELKNCVTADEELGEVVLFTETAATEVRRGIVRIEFAR